MLAALKLRGEAEVVVVAVVEWSIVDVTVEREEVGKWWWW